MKKYYSNELGNKAPITTIAVGGYSTSSSVGLLNTISHIKIQVIE